MKLFYRHYPSATPQAKTLIILHGLFGSCDNWLTQAKILSQHYHVYTVDQRNHGLSPHSDEFDYNAMANDLMEFVAEHKLQNAIVVGHSMGGKTAMNFALAHPEMLSVLVVVDIAPRAYNLEHYTIADGLQAITINTLQSRQQADEQLSAYVEEADVRQFLLKNLQRKPEGGFSWKINLPVISSKLSNIGVDLLYHGAFYKPTLFVKGAKSNYIKKEDEQNLTTRFPQATLETLPTGHWVQAELPQEFCDLLHHYLQKQ
jgi:pimeloyl-ACP methyl ester carboxylesterase